MSEKIYEYKDENNWFIGKMTGHNLISGWGVKHRTIKKIDDLLDGIAATLDWENPKGYDFGGALSVSFISHHLYYRYD